MLQPYNLPDQILLQDYISSYRSLVWIPHERCIVLGNSNKIYEAIWEENVEKDKIPVIKRPTGGQTVLLSPNMLAISIIRNSKNIGPSRQYFFEYNKKIIEILQKFDITDIKVQGISDITLQGKKIVGSAMYRNSQRIFFHAVLNISENSETIERYLKMPASTPAYRQGRNHVEFVTSLADQGFQTDIFLLQSTFRQEMENFL